MIKSPDILKRIGLVSGVLLLGYFAVDSQQPTV